MDTKKLIENIIEDLVNDVPMAKLMLKAQTIAYSLNNSEFKEWIEHEQNGYPNTKMIPDYRVIPCSLKVDIALPFQRIYRNYLLPADLIQNEQDRDFLRMARLTESISSLENMITDFDDQKTLAMLVPGFLWPSINKCLDRDANIIAACQEISPSSIKGVVDSFKSKLLKFFLELTAQMEIDLNVMTNREKIANIMNQTINAGIYSAGGDVAIANSTVIGGKNNSVSISQALKNEIEDVLLQVEDLKQSVEADEHDVAEVMMDIRAELEKATPSKRLLKRGMQALKSFHGVVVEKAIEYGIDQILLQLA
jgi:hypothetical protein